MSSKWMSRGLAAVLSVAMAMSAVSCTPKLGEEAPPQTLQAVDATACLTPATRTLSDFIFGEAQDESLSQAWDCLGGAFEQFHKYIRGSSRDAYTSQDLATFFENNFFERDSSGRPVSTISPALQAEFMKIKQMFVGGSGTVVTRQEVLATVAFLKQLKGMTLRVNRYMKILVFLWEPQETGIRIDDNLEYFEEANKEFQVFFKELGGLIQQNQLEYRLDDAIVLLRELAAFFKEDWEIVATLQRYMPVVKKVKKALTGGSEDVIQADEWSTFLTMGIRGFVQYLRYFYFIKTPTDEGRGLGLNYVARTFEDTISLFEDLVRQKESGKITREELDELLSAFSAAWPDFKYSDKLVTEFMKIKRVLFGGQIDSWAVSDFETGRLKVSRLRLILERFLPYYTVYAGDWDANQDPREDSEQFFDEARFALDVSGREFGSLLEGPYNLNDIKVFLKELEDLYPPEDPEDTLRTVADKYLPLLVRLKNSLYDDQDSQIRKDQWASFLGFGSRVYASYLYYTYFLRDQDQNRPEVMTSLGKVVDLGLNLLRDMLGVKRSGRLSREELLAVAVELQRIGVLPQEVEEKNLDDLLKAILNRVLNPPEKRLAGELPDGIKVSTLDYARAEFRIWLASQMYINSLFVNRTEMTPEQLKEELLRAVGRSGLDADVKTGMRQLLYVTTTNAPFVLDEQGRMLISRKMKLNYNLQSLQLHNLWQTLTRVFFASYAGELARTRSYTGIKVEEANLAYNDVKGFLFDMGIVERGNKGFMNNRFREANIFMPASNGNNFADFQEVENLAFSIMSGLKVSDVLNDQLRKDCQVVKGFTPKDEFGKASAIEKVKYDCLYKSYKKGFETQLSALPGFLKYQKEQDDAVYAFFFKNSLKGAGWVPNSQNMVPLSDAALLPPLIQYIELIYARFDADNDGAVNVPEAKMAFPSFKGLFMELAKDDIREGRLKESDLLALFTYVLRYGKPPSGVWEGLTRWYPWKDDPKSWKVWADRTKIAEILGVIADQITSAENARPERMIPAQ